MQWIATALAKSFIAFVATNIDDLFILTLFFGRSGKNGLGRWHIVAGQYMGFAALLLISLVGYFARLFVARAWIGLLGLLPVAIGVKKFVERRQSEESATSGPAASSVLMVAAVTFANGGDNIGIYLPLFAASESGQLALMMVVFFCMLGVWCAAGYFLGNLPAIRKTLDRYGHLIVPFVLIGLGLYIMYESYTFHELSRLLH